MPSPCFPLRRSLRRVVAAATFCLVGSPVLQAAPVVAVSIKPLEHLVAALTDGVTTPQLVVRTGQDPHHISLRPSERRLLAKADLLLWVGPSMELPLVELVQQIDAAVLTAETLPQLQRISAGTALDPHLWLDTRNAWRIAAAFTQQLIALDAANALQYEANLERFGQQLQQLHEALQQQFAQQAPRQWAVYHNAFRYLEQEFALPPALTLRESDNVDPGLRSVLAFRKALQDAQLNCMVIEPGMHDHDLDAMLDDDSLRTVEADVLGVTLPVAADSFTTLISNVATAIQSCAGAPHE
jgi:zinc transport system substrate-binding protein